MTEIGFEVPPESGERWSLFSSNLGKDAVSWLVNRGWAFYVLWVLVIDLVKYGVGILPSWNFMQAIAQNWRNPHSSVFMTAPADFRLADSASAVLAGWLHLTTGIEFLGFHFLLACTALVIPLLMPSVRRDPRLRAIVGLLLIGSAIPAVLLSWIGSYDPVSIAAAGVAGLSRRPWAASLGWAVFSFNNASQAFVAAIIYAVVLVSDDWDGAKTRLLAAAAGLIVGYTGVQVLISHWGGATGAWTIFRNYGFSRYVDGATSYWPLIAISALGIGWLMIFDKRTRQLRAAKALIVMSLLATIAIPLIAVDETRILAGALWAPLLLTASIIARRIDDKAMRALLRRLLPWALVLVVVVVWDGSLVYAGWHGAWQFANYILGRQPIPGLSAFS